MLRKPFASAQLVTAVSRLLNASLLNLAPEQERAARELVAQFLAGKIGDDVALRLFGEERQRRDSGPARSPATPRQGFALPLLARRVKVLSKYRIQEGSSKPAG